MSRLQGQSTEGSTMAILLVVLLLAGFFLLEYFDFINLIPGIGIL